MPDDDKPIQSGIIRRGLSAQISEEVEREYASFISDWLIEGADVRQRYLLWLKNSFDAHAQPLLDSCMSGDPTGSLYYLTLQYFFDSMLATVNDFASQTSDPDLTELYTKATLLLTGQHSYWKTEALKHLRNLKQPTAPDRDVVQSEARKGYRTEVRRWMKAQGLESVPQAARKLAVSDGVLKSIMSDKGRPRYSAETLANVLQKIGVKDSQ